MKSLVISTYSGNLYLLLYSAPGGGMVVLSNDPQIYENSSLNLRLPRTGNLFCPLSALIFMPIIGVMKAWKPEYVI